MALGRGGCVLLLLAVAAFGRAAWAHSVLVVDSRHNGYLHEASAPATVSQPALQGIVAALTGLQPSARIDASAAQQIASVVKATPLSKPQAHLSVTVSGLTPEDLSTLLAGRAQFAASVAGGQADTVTELLASLAEANPDVAFQLLEQVAAQRCGGGAKQHQFSCVEQLMPAVASALGTEFNSDASTLALPDGTQLDLHQLTDRSFAMELAAAVVGVEDLLQARTQASVQDVLVADLSVVALEQLVNKYGKGSAEALAAKSATLALLQRALQRLDQHFDGDVTLQVAVDVGVSSLNDALAWKSYRHARVLQATPLLANSTKPAWLQGNETALAQRFSAKAAGFGAFILLLYFLLLGIYCLCYMPFQRDTMLFGAKKTE